VETRPYGLWSSDLDPVELSRAKRLRDLAWDSDGKTLVWLEGRGAQGVLVCQRPGQASRDLNSALSVRAQVGYGGGDFAVAHGYAYFVEQSGHLYRQSLDAGAAQALTPAFGHAASPTPSPDGRHLVYVHSENDVDRLAIVDCAGRSWPQILVEGADFYMQPCWHPKGKSLAWVEWDHPQMPWDGCRLVLANLGRRSDGQVFIREKQVIAGGTDEAVFQPCFSPDGNALVYASDRHGWSNLWCRDLASGEEHCLAKDECDVATPAWVQGLRSHGFSADGRLYFTRSEDGGRRAHSVDLTTGTISPVAALADYAHVEQLTPSPKGSALACIASAPKIPARIVVGAGTKVQVRARSSNESLPAADLSTPESVSWQAEDGSHVYGLYYPPASRRFEGKGQPPLIVNIHGGPTGCVDMSFAARAQYFATRGWAFLDLDYRGSTGHGRRYMETLRQNWGLTDVEDAVAAAQYLCADGKADPTRLVICGGSAGGYTVLQALVTRPGFFRAGLCLYGISNLFTLAADTHKFEARYLDSLIGPLPESADIYRERSPIFAADKISDPVAVFQGSEDKVVPPSQAEEIVRSLRRRNVPHVYHLYEGEGHGWRRPDTIEQFYKDVDAFLREHVLYA